MIEVTQRTRVRSGSRPGRARCRRLPAQPRLDPPGRGRRRSSGTACGSSSGSRASTSPATRSYFVVRQGFAAAIGAVGLVVAALVPIDLWRRYWKLVYVATLGLMVVVFVAAEAVRGSKRWLDLGVIQFQPSELGKVLFVLAIAGFVVDRVGPTTRWQTIFTVIGLGAVPILLVFMQPDLGTALVYAAALFAVLFFVGAALAAAPRPARARGRSAIASVLWLLPAAGVQVLEAVPGGAPARSIRDADPAGSPTTSTSPSRRSAPAGSPGAASIDASQTQLDYLPEHATDFAFASLAEQRGFVGCAILLLLYLLVVWRGLRVITGASDLYGVVVAGGLVVALPLPGLRQRRDDDGRGAGDGHPACPSSPSAARRWSRTSC